MSKITETDQRSVAALVSPHNKKETKCMASIASGCNLPSPATLKRPLRLVARGTPLRIYRQHYFLDIEPPPSRSNKKPRRRAITQNTSVEYQEVVKQLRGMETRCANLRKVKLATEEQLDREKVKRLGERRSLRAVIRELQEAIEEKEADIDTHQRFFNECMLTVESLMKGSKPESLLPGARVPTVKCSKCHTVMPIYHFEVRIPQVLGQGKYWNINAVCFECQKAKSASRYKKACEVKEEYRTWLASGGDGDDPKDMTESPNDRTADAGLPADAVDVQQLADSVVGYATNELAERIIED